MAISSTLGGTVNAVPVGVVNPFAGAVAPAGWLLCFGQAVSRTEYSALFAVLSTTYGAGNGSTTFTLPDMRGRAVAGKDDMGGSTANRITAAVTGVSGTTLGNAGGDQRVHAHSHANTVTNNAVTSGNDSPDHTHTVTDIHQDGGAGVNFGYQYTVGSYTSTTRTTSGASARHQHSVTSNVTISNATFPVSGTAASQNLPPTIILNYIIKAQ